MKGLIISFLIIIPVLCNSQEINYPGDIKPKDSAILFAPGLINTGLYTRDFSMSPDGKEIYFSLMAGRAAVIMVSKYENGEWKEPIVAPFSGSKEFFDFEPHVSPDGKQIFFLSTRPQEGLDAKLGWANQNIFVVDRTDNGWSEPYDVGSPVNTENNEFYPSLTNNSKLYFNHSIKFTDVAIYCSQKENEKFLNPEKLSFKNDSNLLLFNATVSRDDSYILTCGSLKTNQNQTKYYVAFNLGNNKWSDLIDLTDYLGYEGGRVASISLSPDGKYIFFSTIIAIEENTTVYPEMKKSEIMENRMKSQIGSSNVYWISSEFIKKLKENTLNNN